MNLSKSTTYDCSFALWKHPQFSPWTQPRVLVESWVSVPEKSGISMKRNLRGSWQSFVNMCLEVQVGNKGEKRYAGALCALIWNLQKYIYNGGLMIACQLLVKDAVSPKMLLSKKRNSTKKNVFDSGNRRLDIFIINQSDNQMIWFLLEEFR